MLLSSPCLPEEQGDHLLTLGSRLAHAWASHALGRHTVIVGLVTKVV